MFNDEFIDGRSGWNLVGLISDQELRRQISHDLRARATTRNRLYRIYEQTGPLTRGAINGKDYVSGGGNLYEIVSGEALVAVEQLQDEGAVQSGKINTMGKKPIEL